MSLYDGQGPELQPMGGAGSGQVQEKERIRMAELIEQLNELFGTDVNDDDQLLYIDTVIKGKLLDSATLQQQAANNTKEQFASSPDLGSELENAIIDALDAHTSMSTKALNSTQIKRGILDFLLERSGLWEELRRKTG